MRQIYKSPRPENIERVVKLMAEHGIETSVSNHSAYRRPSYDRYSYSERGSSNDWPAVEIVHAADLTLARQILRDEAGIEPATRHAEILEAARQSRMGRPAAGRDATARRIRMLSLVAVAVALLVTALKALRVF